MYILISIRQVVGCSASIMDNTSPNDPSYSAKWKIIPTIDPNNMLANKFVVISISLVSSSNVNGLFWNNVSIPEIEVLK